MDGGRFIELVEGLTGTPVKDVTETDRALLGELLAEDGKPIGHSQLNELLLLVNKDRMGRPFFDRFFGDRCTVGSLADSVLAYQKLAMLAYGNFVYAYRILSRADTEEALREELGECARDPDAILAEFEARGEKLVDIELIPREQTPLVGYLSTSQILAETARGAYLTEQLPPPEALAASKWGDYEARVRADARPDEQPALVAMIAKYRKGAPDATVAQFAGHLAEVGPRLRANREQVRAVQRVAARNQDVYLTWDHMDVYFATSMRKRWEFEDLFDFVNGLMAREELARLNLRHFDPTQAYTENRVNKGLVESLMLKRAKCTVYSVQDTDTLGKDSELAATLAQGKPVIAYVPSVDPDLRTAQLLHEDPATVNDRLRFVLHADDQSIAQEEFEFIRGFQAIDQFERDRVWRTVPDDAGVDAFRAAHGTALERLCRIVASSEARIYDRRARTLKETHPLGIQVNLATGVANGVLVVRTIPQCAALLRGVVTNSLEFELRDEPADRMWYLIEKISGCAYRVVSKDRKLTNCFWNFYRRPHG